MSDRMIRVVVDEGGRIVGAVFSRTDMILPPDFELVAGNGYAVQTVQMPAEFAGIFEGAERQERAVQILSRYRLYRGGESPQLVGAITAVRSIRNSHSSEVYLVRNRQNPNDTGGPRGSLGVAPGEVVPCNIWIPWCVSEADFRDRRASILMVPIVANVLPVRFNIWQQGDYVRYSKDGLFYQNGELVRGNNTVSGDRSIEISGSDLFDAELTFF